MTARTAPVQRADIRKILARLQRATSDLARAMDDQELTFEEAALLYAALDRPIKPGRKTGLTQQLAVVRDAARSICAGAFPRSEKQQAVAGAGLLERGLVGKKRVWDGNRLARVLASRIADEGHDRGSGETLPLGVVCERVAATLIDCAGLDTQGQQWRVGKVELFGLVPAEFYEDHGGRPSVHFVD